MNSAALERPRPAAAHIAADRCGRVLLFATWLVLVAVQVAHHVFWRDEVRALSLALQGETPWQMLGMLRGEGHPALWYLLLRFGHEVIPDPAVLSVLALAVGAAAAALLVFAAPFPLWLVALILASGPLLFEYVVMARNYGIAVALLFAIAALYDRLHRRTLWLGLLVALLANTNAHAILLGAGFMLAWLLDLLRTRPAPLLLWALNAVVAACGMLASIATLYPPVNDAVLAARPPPSVIAQAFLLPGTQFGALTTFSWSRVLGLDWTSIDPGLPIVLGSALLFGAAVGLRTWWPGLVAALAALLALSGFFALVYPGDDRHVGLYLAFLIALYWIAWRNPGRHRKPLCLALLIALQVPAGLHAVIAGDSMPRSSVRRFAAALAAEPALADAVLIPDPDFLLEAFPAYGTNPIQLPRSRRFASVAHFTRREPEILSLDTMLRQAEALCRSRHGPAILVIATDLASASWPIDIAEGYTLRFTATQDAIRRLGSETRFLGRFEPSTTGEDFSAYVLSPPCGAGAATDAG